MRAVPFNPYVPDSQRMRKPTVLIHLGTFSLSKRAFELGLFLAAMQVLDGLLTFIGLSIFGIHMEGNIFMRHLISAYGAFPALFVTKAFAITCVGWLTIQAHSRRWIRPAIGFVAGIYLTLAIIPWTYLISSAH